MQFVRGLQLDTHKLEIFTKIAELKSYSLAAGYFSLSQPTVSHHMTALEDSLGLPLFDRRGKEVILTPAGEILYRYSRRIKTVAELAFQTLAFYRGDKTGTLTIVSGHLLGEYILPVTLKRFLDRFPAATGSIRIASAGDIPAAVLAGDADLGFVGEPVKEECLHSSLFFSDELVLIVPRGHRWQKRATVKAAELMCEPFVARMQDTCLRSVCDIQLASAGVAADSLNIVLELGSITAVKQAVKSGFGIALLPLSAVREELALNVFKLLRIRGMKLAKDFFMIHDNRHSVSPLGQEFIGILETHA